MPGSFGIITAEFPVIAEERSVMPDETWAVPRASFDNNAAIVILTTEKFYFGQLSSFGKELSSVNNKFQISHVEGAPDLPRLVNDLKKWQANVKASRSLVFVPTEEIPMPIVIQCFQALKTAGLFDHVIMGGGVL